GLNVAIGKIALLLQRDILRQLNALHTQAALLHHAAGAHRHIGIEHHAAQRALHVVVEIRILGVVVPIEAPHLVRTVIGAVASADAAVVDLLIDALGAGGGGVHRTDRLARCVPAVLTHHGLIKTGGIVRGPAVVVVDANPVHDANTPYLILAHHRYIVLRLAGN